MAIRPLVNVRLDPELTEELDELAAERGATRSDLLREGIDLVLEAGGRRHHHRGGRHG